MSHLPRSVSKWEGRCPICRAACQSGRADVPSAAQRVKVGGRVSPPAAPRRASKQGGRMSHPLRLLLCIAMPRRLRLHGCLLGSRSLVIYQRQQFKLF